MDEPDRTAMTRRLSNRGIALLMVLWVLMLLSVIVGEFCYTMRTQVNITGNFKETIEARYIALAGINRVIYDMVHQSMIPPPADGTEDGAEGDEAFIRWRINAEMPPIAYAGGRIRAWIDNESGRVNINLADRGLLMLMLSGFDLEDEEKEIIADSILDWRDPDDLRRLNGAENEYYESLPAPYSCKNGPFDTVAELLLVRGVTPEIFYNGIDRMVTVIPKVASGDASTDRKSETDYNRLNINAISSRLWAGLPGITEDMVARIAAFRQNQDFLSMSELGEIVGNDILAGISPYLTTRPSPYFKIRAVGEKQESRIYEGIEAVIRLDNRLSKRYRIIEWIEGIPPDISGIGGKTR
jgi:general secretion pathway protein K